MTKEAYESLILDRDGMPYGWIICTEEPPKRRGGKPSLTIWFKGYDLESFKRCAYNILKATNTPDDFIVINPRHPGGAAYKMKDVYEKAKAIAA